MAARKKIWDLGEPDSAAEPREVEMWAVDADEAHLNHPERWTFNPPEGSAGATPIPADWADLPNSKKRGLAIRLGAPNTIKATQVDEFIQAEVDNRAPPAAE